MEALDNLIKSVEALNCIKIVFNCVIVCLVLRSCVKIIDGSTR